MLSLFLIGTPVKQYMPFIGLYNLNKNRVEENQSQMK